MREFINIKEVREARKEAERQIEAALSSFNAATGLHIMEVEVKNFQEHPFHVARPVIVSQSVMATLEQI